MLNRIAAYIRKRNEMKYLDNCFKRLNPADQEAMKRQLFKDAYIDNKQNKGGKNNGII